MATTCRLAVRDDPQHPFSGLLGARRRGTIHPARRGLRAGWLGADLCCGVRVVSKTYELRTARGARHMVFDTLDSARERRDRVAGRIPLQIVEVITTTQERVIV